MRRTLTALLLVALALGGCGDDDAASDGAGGDTIDADGGDAADPRFCDVYLAYLADSTGENLAALERAAGDDRVSEYTAVIESPPDIDRLLAATLDLDDLARSRCQSEWTAGAQGAGNTPAAAQAFLDAVVAGDRDGARNVASANAIAVFEPWEPVAADPEVGSPAVTDVGGQSFSLVLGATSVAQCEVETGVVVACQLVEAPAG